jgi:hypothetical protein
MGINQATYVKCREIVVNGAIDPGWLPEISRGDGV